MLFHDTGPLSYINAELEFITLPGNSCTVSRVVYPWCMTEAENIATSPRPPSRGRRLIRAAWYYLPVALWLGVITLASTDLGSADRTESVLTRLVRLLVPDSSGDPFGDDLDGWSFALRKGAHVFVYAVLALLTARAVRGLFPRYGRGSFWRAALVVLPFGVVVAAADEFHQMLVASRDGSLWDVLLDVAGLLVGLMLAWLVLRRRLRRAS